MRYLRNIKTGEIYDTDEVLPGFSYIEPHALVPATRAEFVRQLYAGVEKAHEASSEIDPYPAISVGTWTEAPFCLTDQDMLTEMGQAHAQAVEEEFARALANQVNDEILYGKPKEEKYTLKPTLWASLKLLPFMLVKREFWREIIAQGIIWDILNILAIVFFLVGICVEFYLWMLL